MKKEIVANNDAKKEMFGRNKDQKEILPTKMLRSNMPMRKQRYKHGIVCIGDSNTNEDDVKCVQFLEFCFVHTCMYKHVSNFCVI